MLLNLKAEEMFNQVLKKLDFLVKVPVFLALHFKQISSKKFPFIQSLNLEIDTVLSPEQ